MSNPGVYQNISSADITVEAEGLRIRQSLTMRYNAKF